jgi:membrane-associated phospholipid phosphatase
MPGRLFALALLACAPTAAAGQVAPAPAAADSGAVRPAPLLAEADLLARASVHALTAPLRWRAREWMLAGGSVAGVAIASIADEDGRELMAEIRTECHTRIEELIEPFGAEGSLAILGGMLAAGLALDDAKLRMTAAEGLAASLVAGGIVTPTLQAMIGRSKPRDGMPAHTFDPFGGRRSLPSGHTTQAFAVASVIAAEYDHPLVQTGVYGMAVAVGVSRMYRRSHFVSDVVGGAIIGTAVGRAVARFGQDRRETMTVIPQLSEDGAGLMFRRSF